MSSSKCQGESVKQVSDTVFASSGPININRAGRELAAEFLCVAKRIDIIAGNKTPLLVTRLTPDQGGSFSYCRKESYGLSLMTEGQDRAARDEG